MKKEKAKKIAILIQNKVREFGLDAYIFFGGHNDFEICFGYDPYWKAVPIKKIFKAMKPIQKEFELGEIGACSTATVIDENSFVLNHKQKTYKRGKDGYAYPTFAELQYKFNKS